jgi:hypothetical protein
VAAAFAALGADQVDTEVEALLHVFGVTDHCEVSGDCESGRKYVTVHVEDAMLVELLDDLGLISI